MLPRKTKECASCGNVRPIYALKLCGNCYTKQAQKKALEKARKRIAEGKSLDKNKLQDFYKWYWENNTERYCYECGTPLYKYKSWHILHIIPKKDWKKYNIDIVYNVDNIRYGCLSCHSRFDNGEESPKLNNLKQKLEQQWKDLN